MPEAKSYDPRFFIMRHSSIVVTKDIYTHIKSRKHKTELAEKFNSHLAESDE